MPVEKLRPARIMPVILAVVMVLGAAHYGGAEEQKDLYEGITESYGNDARWGVLPRFKLNPETGFGSGLKLKATNPFGAPVLLELSNLYTTTGYQQYEAAVVLPPLNGRDGGPYAIFYAGYDRIPDTRIFGTGNHTRRGAGGDEATFLYGNLASRLTAGWNFSGRYFGALHAFYRRVWTGDGEGDDLPQAREMHSALPGMGGGITPGAGFSLIRSTREGQWRPREGTRLELTAEEAFDAGGGEYSYGTAYLDARAYRNIFGDYNVVAARVQVRSAFGDEKEIPWWALSQVGGRDSIRGYWEGRFRDRAAAVVNAEFRFHIYDMSFKAGRARPAFTLDGTFFADAGRVYGEGDDMATLQEWKYSGGAGLRLVTGPNLMGRLDVGFCREKTGAVYFNFGTVF